MPSKAQVVEVGDSGAHQIAESLALDDAAAAIDQYPRCADVARELGKPGEEVRRAPSDPAKEIDEVIARIDRWVSNHR